MTRHMIRLVWNRRRSNALLAVEIFFSFLVLLAIAVAVVYFADAWRKPLGFDYENVWKIAVDTRGTEALPVSQTTTATTANPESVVTTEPNVALQTFERLLREIETFDSVEAAAAAVIGPYDIGSMTGTVTHEGRRIRTEMTRVTDRFNEVVRLDLVAGRWFNADDRANSWRPVVIDRETAALFYGSADPVGRIFEPGASDGSSRETRVVGVVSDFRRAGELGAASNFVFRRSDLTIPAATLPRSIFVRLRPGTGGAFEEQLLRRLFSVAPEWSFEITPLERARERMFRLQLMPVIIGGTIALFLLLMVSFGLIGVLWQAVTQRRSELALRRAVGASRESIGCQIVSEMLLVATAGIVVALLLVVQAPALGLLELVPRGVFLTALALALVLMYGLVIVSSLYPGLLATRVEPAQALRSE
jgi:putative ABC transport system permease protein